MLFNTVLMLCIFCSIVYITLQNWNKFGCFFLQIFVHKRRKGKSVLRVLASDYVEKS